MNSTVARQIVQETAAQLGFSRVVVAGLDPMEAERKLFEAWLNRGFAGTMHYLGRNPEARTSPRLLHPDAYCALILFVPYYTETPADPGARFGRVARYAVGLDYHSVIPAKLALLKARLEEKLERPLLGRCFTDDVELFEPGFAARAGLGFVGKNTLVIGPQLSGSYHFIAELFTDLPLEPDQPYRGTCGSCFRCGIACPTGAIVEAGSIDARLCISYLTIENKAEIPLHLREQIGRWVFGCDVCQEVCPYNQRPAEAAWAELKPERGVGHFLDLYQVLSLKTKKEYMRVFGHTALSRPRRRGLTRNALVVLGNQTPPDGVSVLHDFARQEEEPMLREHAAWALSRYATGQSRRYLADLIEHEPVESVRSAMRMHLERAS